MFISTPDLRIWDPKKQTAIEWGTCLVIAACLSENRGALYINGQQFFPPRDVNSPPKLRAPQAEYVDGNPRREIVREVVLFDLDYKWDVKMVARDMQGSGYRSYAEIDGTPYYDGVYELTLDILGASVSGGFDTLMRSPEQNCVKLMIRTKSVGKSWRQDDLGNIIRDQINLSIESSSIAERGWRKYKFPYAKGLRSACSIWSWRCADLRDGPWYASTYNGPWYSIVMRHEFDEFGRIGCGRRAVVKSLSALQEVLGGPEGVKLLLIIGGAILLWSIRWYFRAIANFYILVAKAPWRTVAHFYRAWREDRQQELEFKKLEDEGLDMDLSSATSMDVPEYMRRFA